MFWMFRGNFSFFAALLFPSLNFQIKLLSWILLTSWNKIVIQTCITCMWVFLLYVLFLCTLFFHHHVFNFTKSGLGERKDLRDSNLSIQKANNKRRNSIKNANVYWRSAPLFYLIYFYIFSIIKVKC